MSDTAPDAALRDQIADAIHHGPRLLTPAEIHAYVDAVMPVVAAALTAARASCCEDGDRTYAEMERHLTERAEQAERERDEALEALAYGAETLQCAEQAEAAVQRVRAALVELKQAIATEMSDDESGMQRAVDLVGAALDRPADPPAKETPNA